MPLGKRIKIFLLFNVPKPERLADQQWGFSCQAAACDCQSRHGDAI